MKVMKKKFKKNQKNCTIQLQNLKKKINESIMKKKKNSKEMSRVNFYRKIEKREKRKQMYKKD